MRILLIEDDYLQAEAIEEDIKRNLPGSEVTLIATEKELRDQLDAILREPPDVAVLDVMVRYTDPGEIEPTLPDDAKAGGFMRAGIRCAQMIAKRNAKIPIILYTILEKEGEVMELEKNVKGRNVVHITKEPDNRRLLEELRRIRDSVKHR